MQTIGTISVLQNACCRYRCSKCKCTVSLFVTLKCLYCMLQGMGKLGESWTQWSFLQAIG